MQRLLAESLEDGTVHYNKTFAALELGEGGATVTFQVGREAEGRGRGRGWARGRGRGRGAGVGPGAGPGAGALHRRHPRGGQAGRRWQRAA
jgi:hypothetical protein